MNVIKTHFQARAPFLSVGKNVDLCKKFNIAKYLVCVTQFQLALLALFSCPPVRGMPQKIAPLWFSASHFPLLKSTRSPT